MNHPFFEVLENMDKMISEGHTVYLKFTCVHCKARQTSESPNTLNLGGYYCEECKGLTLLSDLQRDGINFLLVMKA